MKKEDVKVIIGTALLTATLAVVLCRIPSAVATDEQARLPHTGVLTVGDSRVSLQFDKPGYMPGDKPSVVISAVGGADCKSPVKVDMNMTTTTPPSEMSRMVRAPANIWSDSCFIAVAPNETKRIVLLTDVAVTPGHVLALTAKAGGNTARLSCPVAQSDADTEPSVRNVQAVASPAANAGVRQERG